MKVLTTIDYAYPIVLAIIALIMIFSPSAFLTRVKYSEETAKTENLLKWLGGALLMFCTIFAGYIYYYISTNA